MNQNGHFEKGKWIEHETYTRKSLPEFRVRDNEIPIPCYCCGKPSKQTVYLSDRPDIFSCPECFREIAIWFDRKMNPHKHIELIGNTE